MGSSWTWLGAAVLLDWISASALYRETEADDVGSGGITRQVALSLILRDTRATVVPTY